MRNCSLSMRRYFRLPSWGWLNVSKEILLTLSKFHEKLPSRSRDIKSFLLGKRECTPSSLSTKVFPTGRMGRKSSPLTKSLLISHTHFLFPSPNKGSFPHSCYNLVKTSFIVHTSHANFDFNRCSRFRECYFLALKRVQMVKLIHSSSDPHYPIKNPAQQRGIFSPTA